MAVRSFLSALLTLVAIAATVLAVPSFWLDQRIVDQAGFVATVAPMAENQQVKDYLADEIAAQATARTDLPIAGVLVRPLAGRHSPSGDTGVAIIQNRRAAAMTMPAASSHHNTSCNVHPRRRGPLWPRRPNRKLFIPPVKSKASRPIGNAAFSQAPRTSHIRLFQGGSSLAPGRTQIAAVTTDDANVSVF